MNAVNRCARCEKPVYPTEELKCLDKVWHKICFKCQECGMTLNMKTYKGFDKLPYCNAHTPVAKHTAVADTPEARRLAENTKIQSQVKYHEEFERTLKGKVTQVADDPEMARLKQTAKIISNVEYHREIDKKQDMEMRRRLVTGEHTPIPLPGYVQGDINQDGCLVRLRDAFTGCNIEDDSSTIGGRSLSSSRDIGYSSDSSSQSHHQQGNRAAAFNPMTCSDAGARGFGGYDTAVSSNAGRNNIQYSGFSTTDYHGELPSGRNQNGLFYTPNQMMSSDQLRSQHDIHRKRNLETASSSVDPRTEINSSIRERDQSVGCKPPPQRSFGIAGNEAIQNTQVIGMSGAPKNRYVGVAGARQEHPFALLPNMPQSTGITLPQPMGRGSVAHQTASAAANQNGSAEPILHQFQGIAAAQHEFVQPQSARIQTQMGHSHQAAQDYQFTQHRPDLLPQQKQIPPQGQCIRDNVVYPQNAYHNRQPYPEYHQQQQELYQIPSDNPIAISNTIVTRQQNPNLQGKFRAIFDYAAQDSDEVTFLDGDLIEECISIDEGWMVGRVMRTGRKGMLPSNYVQPC